jgi:hypothetical protein
VLVLVPLVLAMAGCTGSSHSSKIVVSVAGRVGPLAVDRSGRHAVVHFAGRPDAELHGREPGSPKYDAVGYDCARKPGQVRFPLVSGRAPSCRTVFWLDARSGRLEDFYSSDTRYSESHGLEIGTASGVAEKRLHQRLYLGCEENLLLASPKASLTVAFTGGSTHRQRNGGLRVRGARVFAFVLHSKRRGAGVFDCM